MTIDLTSLLAGFSLPLLANWIASFFALRRQERTIEIEQITKERAKWRKRMRKLTKDIACAYFDNKIEAIPGKIAGLRAQLATSINPVDDQDDRKILEHFDDLFSGNKSDLNIFSKRISLLLKHDWERVKWECKPIYVKCFTRYSSKQRKWRHMDYRLV